MRTGKSCGWCHRFNWLEPGLPTFCWECGHRADLSRLLCDCGPCRGRAAAALAERIRRAAQAPGADVCTPEKGGAG